MSPEKVEEDTAIPPEVNENEGLTVPEASEEELTVPLIVVEPEGCIILGPDDTTGPTVVTLAVVETE